MLVRLLVGVVAVVGAVGISTAVALIAQAVNFDLFWWLRWN